MSGKYPVTIGIVCEERGCHNTLEQVFWMTEEQAKSHHEGRANYILSRAESLGWTFLGSDPVLMVSWCPEHPHNS